LFLYQQVNSALDIGLQQVETPTTPSLLFVFRSVIAPGVHFFLTLITFASHLPSAPTAKAPTTMAFELPPLPVPIADFVGHVNKHPDTQNGVAKAVEPFKIFENKLREVYAQHPDHPAAIGNHLVPVFKHDPLTIRARNVAEASPREKAQYLLPLPDDARRKHGSPATVHSLKDFKTNFNLFSELSLVDLDWSNVVCAGSAVVTSLLPVDAPHNESRVTASDSSHFSRLTCF
jgi:hypothetical protein